MSVAPSTSTAPSVLPAWWRIGAWAAVMAAGLVLLCSQWYGPDIWYHLYLGDRILATHSIQPVDNLLATPALFLNIYWLFQIAISLVYRCGGVTLTSLLFITSWAVAFRFWLKTSKASHAGALGAGCALAAILVCQPRFDPRPEVVSYALLALQIYWLTAWDFSAPLAWKKLAAFAASEVLWANVHGYFVFGPLLVGARLLAALVDPRPESRRSAARTLLWLLSVTLAATVISPLGWRTWECVALLSKTLRDLRTDVQEFYPPIQINFRWWTVKLFWLCWMAGLLGTIVTLFRAPRRAFFALTTGAGGLILSALALRNLPLLVFFSAPVMAETFSFVPPWRRWASAAYAGVALAALALGAWAIDGGFYESLHSLSGFGLGEATEVYPARFSAYLRTAKFGGKMFNAARDGGYLEFHQPTLRLYGDSRFVEAESVRAYFAAVGSPRAFAQLHAQQHFDGALLPLDLGRDTIGALLKNPGWRLAYADLHRAFLVDTDASAAAASPPIFDLYHGEDLKSAKNGPFAAQWIVILTLANDRPHLLLALQQLAASRALPSFVGEFALRYAHEFNDGEIARLVRVMRPKFFAGHPEDQRQLDEAFAATTAL